MNLNGLLNESLKPEAPKTSPLATPAHRNDEVVDLILRPNIKDPLNLEGTYDSSYKHLLNDNNRKARKHRRSISKIDDVSQKNNAIDIELIGDIEANANENDNFKQKQRINKRKRAHSFSINESCSSTKNTKINCTTSDEHLNSCFINETGDINFEKTVALNRSVSCTVSNLNVTSSVSFNKQASVVTFDSSEQVIISINKGSNSIPITSDDTKATVVVNNAITTQTSVSKEVKFEKNGFKFKHGNYNRYYGYRNPSNESDHRLDHFKSEWFKDKEVLDIGKKKKEKILY